MTVTKAAKMPDAAYHTYNFGTNDSVGFQIGEMPPVATIPFGDDHYVVMDGCMYVNCRAEQSRVFN